MLRRISELVADIKINPKFGIGKPERLKYQSENVWSRRIDKKHRLVYLIRDGGVVLIIQCRFHYRDR
jgi:toxin YoeB